MNDLFIPVKNENYPNENLGGKANCLVELQKGNFNVPPFFVIPFKTIKSILDPINIKIDTLIHSLVDYQSDQLETVCHEIQRMITNLELNDNLINKINVTCDTLFPKGSLFAIRSSGGSEDSIHASFAGQHTSFLLVEKEHIISSIKLCIASAWNHGAITYRLAKNISIHKIDYAVIVQEMIHSSKSGISFSMNVGGNLADTIIVAGFGMGDGVVQGLTETECYIVNRQNFNIQKHNNKVQTADALGIQMGNKRTMVFEPDQHHFVLSDEQIKAVFELTIKTESLLNKPVDIEFSIDDKGEIYILQMRPITTIDTKSIKILDNTNIVESYPGVTLPLTFSFVKSAYENVFSNCSGMFFIPEHVLKQKGEIFKNLLSHYYGRIYYQLDNWYRMMSLVYSSPHSITAWENAVGLLHSERDKVSYSLQNHIRTTLVFIWLLINYFNGNRRFFKSFKKNYEQLRNITPFKGNAAALWFHYESVTGRLFKPWPLTLVNDFLSFKFFDWLQRLLIRSRTENSDSLANDLLCGIKGVESEKAIVSFLMIKDLINKSKILTHLFSQSEKVINDTLNLKEYAKINEMMNRHLENYGDRTLAELKLETNSLRSNRASFIIILKNHLRNEMDVTILRSNQQKIQREAWQKVYYRLVWWNPFRYLIIITRNLAAYGLRSRENMRFCRTRAYAGVKDIFKEIGRIMFERGVIDDADDVFWLSVDDLKDFCLGNKPNELRKIILIHKEMFRHYERVSPPDRVIYTNNDLPVLNEHITENNFTTTSVKGIAVSKGTVIAEAAIVLKPDFTMDIRGKILISQMTDPGWVFLMMQAAGLVCEKGSLLSHTAIVGRELGIPVIMGVSNATSIFQNGEQLKMNGSTGVIEKVSTLK